MNKLFVIVRTDLNISQPAVQAGHAVAQFLLDNPDSDWKNETLIYLGVDNLSSLCKIIYKLDARMIKYSIFEEPDIRFGGQLTAIALTEEVPFISKLKLL